MRFRSSRPPRSSGTPRLGRRLIALVGQGGPMRPNGRKDADRINADFLAWLPSGATGRSSPS